MLRSGLILVSTLISLNSISSSDFQKTPDQYWAETGLTLKDIAQRFKKDCYKNSVNYLACVQGLNVVASYLKANGIFATAKEVENNPTVFGPVVKKYGPYTLYQMQKLDENASPRDAWEKIKFFRANQLQAANQVFRSQGTKRIKFEDVLLELKPQVLQGDFTGSEASIAAETYNAYLESAVDPHTHIDPKVQVDDQHESEDFTYAGIGVGLQVDADQIVVKNVAQGGPSLVAGVKANDVISTVDGIKVTGFGTEDVNKKLKGPEGTSVKIGVLRSGNPMEFTLVRKTIVIRNVETRLVEDTGTLYGYIKLRNFNEEEACQRIDDAIYDFEDKGAKGIILDLRDNPGGLLGQATCIASLFVGKKLIVKVSNIKNKRFTSYYGQNDQVTSLPLVTIMNSSSASASEVLAGAIQDYQRGWVVGDRSFGKATVQEPSPWSDKIIIYDTVARFYQPSGRTSQSVGISPDFPLAPDDFSLREADYHTNALPQLGQPWIETRPDEVEDIHSCMDSKLRTDDEADYQLLNSEVLLGCDQGP